MTLQPPILRPPTLRQLLLLPLLAPLLAVVLLGGLNLRPWVSLRLLVWSTPRLPLGSWLVLAAAGGGLLSAGAANAALRSGPSAGWRRVRRPAEAAWSAQEPWEPASSPPRSSGPVRPAGQPAPTVAVPYRVLRQGSGGTASTAAASSAAPGSTPSAAAATTAPAAAATTAATATASAPASADDWLQGPSDDW